MDSSYLSKTCLIISAICMCEDRKTTRQQINTVLPTVTRPGLLMAWGAHFQKYSTCTVLTQHYAPFDYKSPFIICKNLLWRYISIRFMPPPPPCSKEWAWGLKYLVASVPSAGVLNVCKAIKNWTVERLGNEATQHTPNGKKVTLINQPDTQCCTCMILASHYLDTCGLVPFLFMLFRFPVHPYTIKLSWHPSSEKT